MKKYAVIIAALILAQGARANHQRYEYSSSSSPDHCICSWTGWPMKADSSVRGAMTPYSTQHMILPSEGDSVSVIEFRPRADSSVRGAQMQSGDWQGSAGSSISSSSDSGSYSTDLEYQAEPGVAIDDRDSSFEADVQLPEQGAPATEPDTGTQSSRDLNDNHPSFDSSSDRPASLDIQSDIHSDASGSAERSLNSESSRSFDDSSKSSDYRSERSSDLSSPQSESLTPEQGAPATTPDTGTDLQQDRSFHGEANLEGKSQLQPSESSKSDFKPLESQPEAGAPAQQPNSGVDSSYKGTANADLSKDADLNTGVDKSTGATGVTSKDSIDTTVRPGLALPDSTGKAGDDLGFSERLRTQLTTGNEGRPGSFSSTTLQDVKINSHAGVVTLKGKVGSDQEKRDIEARVKEMPGVLSVNNMLEVSGTSSATTPEIK